MAAASGEFEGGSQNVAKAFKGPTLKISHSTFSLTIKDDSEFPFSVVDLNLFPFDVGMLTRPFTRGEMKNGFFYSIKGTHLGTCMMRETGPGGMPLSTQYIRAFCLHGQYAQDSLTIKIECEAYYARTPSPKDLAEKPWIFHVWFKVPRAEMKMFLCIADHNYARFEADLDACQ